MHQHVLLPGFFLTLLLLIMLFLRNHSAPVVMQDCGFSCALSLCWVLKVMGWRRGGNVREQRCQLPCDQGLRPLFLVFAS